MVELARAESKLLEFRERRPARPALILAVTALAFLGIPVLAPGSLTEARWFAAVLLSLFVLGCAVSGWPRSRRFRIAFERNGFSLDGLWIEATAGNKIVLGPSPNEVPIDGREDYEARLVLAHGGDRLLLRGPNPATLVNALTEIHRLWGLAIGAGWGLPEHFFRSVTAAPMSRGADWEFRDVVGLIHPAQKRTGYALLVGSLFILGFSLVELGVRGIDGTVTFWFSTLLMGLATLLVLCLGLLVLTARVHFEGVQGALVIRERTLGLTLKQRRLSKDDVLGAFALSPMIDTPEVRHVVLLTRSGALGFRCMGEAALAVAGQVPFLF